MKLLSDNPATVDTLGLGATANLLARIILTTSPPFTVGLFGEWGSGKTTLMRMISERLRAEKRKTVWFNAWKYDGKEVIWNALIQAIFYAMRDDPDIKHNERRADFRKRVGAVAVALAKYAAKVGTRFIPGGVVKEEDVDELADSFKAPDATGEQFEFINKFESTFDTLVKEYLGDDTALTIFIDDLDRCLPENAIAILESLKLYLESTSCVFVIGAEAGIIEQGINLRYGQNTRLSPRDYIEKIVQLPFMMRGIDAGNALALLQVNNEMNAFLKEDEARRLITEATSNNPRRLKRYLNALLVLETLSGPLKTAERMILSKVLLIQMRFPELYYEMLRDPETANTLSDILSLNQIEQEAAVNGKTDAIRRLYADHGLRQFLDRTRKIPCTAAAVKPWIQLTNGNMLA